MLCLLLSKIHSEKQFNKPKLPVKLYFPIFGINRDSHFERKVIISKNYDDNRKEKSQNVLVSVGKDNIKTSKYLFIKDL